MVSRPSIQSTNCSSFSALCWVMFTQCANARVHGLQSGEGDRGLGLERALSDLGRAGRAAAVHHVLDGSARPDYLPVDEVEDARRPVR